MRLHFREILFFKTSSPPTWRILLVSTQHRQERQSYIKLQHDIIFPVSFIHYFTFNEVQFICVQKMFSIIYNL